jgi:hypothetical protein
MVAMPGASSGQTSRTGQGAWSTTSRLAGPRLRGPRRARSPSRARTSSPAPSAAAMTSRSMGPRGPGRRRRAIDADINRHPAEAPGAGQPPPLGGHLAKIKESLHGTNHRIGSAAAMVKTARVI